MTSTSLKGKITTTFPARVSAVAPLTLTANNGNYTFAIDTGFLEDLVPTTDFLTLTDTPDSYAGQAGNVATVNVGETGLEFLPGGGGGAAAIEGVVYLSDYLSGVGDQTANVQAAFTVLAGTGGTLIWDADRIIVTDTIICGVNGFASSSGPTSFINILCPKGPDISGLDYNGPTDRPALMMCKNKMFWVKGLSVRNIAGSTGTTTGIMLGGQGIGGSGTATLAGSWRDCNVVGFATGIQAGGNFGDASEHYFESLKLYNNDIGFTAVGFDCLDFQFNMLSMSDNGIGISSGASDGFHVFTGSATNNGIDFQVDANGHVSITGWRFETNIDGTLFVKGLTGNNSVSIRSCLVHSNAVEGPAIAGTFKRISVNDSEIDGWVETNSTCQELTIHNTILRVDPTTKLPFFFNMDSAYAATPTISVTNNLDYAGVTPVSDFQGIFRYSNLDGAPFNANVYDPAVLRLTEVPIAANSAAEFGANYLALSRVRQLAEGPVAGNLVPTSVNVVTSAATAGGSAVLTFASVPTTVVPFMQIEDTTTGGVIAGGTYVVSKTATTVTMSNVALAGGVLNGDTIRFWNHFGAPASGKNLRVTGTFAASATFALLFKRPVTVSGMGFASQQLVANAPSRFYPTDVGKPLRIVNEGTGSWSDLYANIVKYIDSTHVLWQPGMGQTLTTVTALSSAFIGEDEPDANFIVAGLAGDVNENFWVDGTVPFATTGFTLKSSNAASTANVVAMIVR